jgi:hypothetical protein
MMRNTKHDITHNMGLTDRQFRTLGELPAVRERVLVRHGITLIPTPEMRKP